VTAAFDRRQAVTLLELAAGCREVGDSDQCVIEFQR
jgi:hypothetical protein